MLSLTEESTELESTLSCFLSGFEIISVNNNEDDEERNEIEFAPTDENLMRSIVQPDSHPSESLIIEGEMTALESPIYILGDVFNPGEKRIRNDDQLLVPGEIIGDGINAKQSEFGDKVKDEKNNIEDRDDELWIDGNSLEFDKTTRNSYNGKGKKQSICPAFWNQKQKVLIFGGSLVIFLCSIIISLSSYSNNVNPKNNNGNYENSCKDACYGNDNHPPRTESIETKTLTSSGVIIIDIIQKEHCSEDSKRKSLTVVVKKGLENVWESEEAYSLRCLVNSFFNWLFSILLLKDMMEGGEDGVTVIDPI